MSMTSKKMQYLLRNGTPNNPMPFKNSNGSNSLHHDFE